MKTNIILVLIFLLAIILETTLLPIPLVLLVFLAITNLSIKNLVIWAFIVGLSLDIFSLRIWGSTSLFLLIIVFLIERYRQKLDPTGIYFQIILLIASVLIYFYLFYRDFDLLKIIISVVLGIFLIFIVRKLTPEKKGKVKLDI